MAGYDVAQICLNGHVVNSSTQRFPKNSADFCTRCGEATITSCPECGAAIRGSYSRHGWVAFEGVPKYCAGCGRSFPWTQSRLQAARDFVKELSDLTEEEQLALATSIEDLVKETPATQVAAVRYRKYVLKAGKAAATALRDILVDLVSETAKKMLWPP